MKYTKKVMDHALHPKHVGKIKNPDGKATEGNISCGDELTLYIKVKNNKIKDIKFSSFGCSAALASSDALCELAIGKTIKEAEKITAKDITKYLGGLPKIKFHCSVLGMKALKKAIENYKKKSS